MDSEPLPESSDIILPIILPMVRRLIACDAAYFDDDEGRWVMKGPWSVRFLDEGVEFPFQPAELWVYIELTGGLGPVCLGVLVDRKTDFMESPEPAEDFQPQFHTVWARANTEPYSFPPDASRQTVFVVSVPLAELEFPDEGAYEFRVLALIDVPGKPEPEIVPLRGESAEVFVLDPARRL